MAQPTVESLLADRRNNALLCWALIGSMGLVAAGSVFRGDLAWAAFVGSGVALCVIPALAFRDPTVMLPWEVVALAALPTSGRAVATLPITGEVAVYLSVAALALVVAVELYTFTSVKMSFGFAILFVVVTTMAAAGIWAVSRWAVDTVLGTGVLLVEGADPDVVHDELMVEFFYSAAAGLVAGLVFEFYFRRRAPVEQRVPDEVAEDLEERRPEVTRA